MAKSEKSTVTQVLEALKILKAADPADVSKVVEDADLAKAAASVENIPDRWQTEMIHAGAKKEEIKVGPEQESSGAGAPKMIREYSEPTPQSGATLALESYSRILGPMADALKSLVESQKTLVTKIDALVTAKASDDEDDEEEEESEVVEINEKAKSLFKKARKILTKAADSDDVKAIATAKSEAAALLRKAQLNAALGGDEALQKSIADLITKADINVVQEEEEEEEDEEEKAKKAKEAAKAGAKDDPKAPAENQDIWAEVKSLSDKLDGALNGLGTLKMSIGDVMTTLAGRAAAGGQAKVPDFAKAVDGMPERIAKAQEVGSLDDTDAPIARDIANMFQQEKLGKIPVGIAKARLGKASAAVRGLFADVA